MISTEPAAGSDVSPELCRTITAASDIDSLLGQGEIEVECGAFAMAALHANFPRMFLNDAVGYGQTESRASRLAFAGSRLGGEKWIVDAVDVFLRNSGAGIRDHYANVVAIAR